DILKRPQTIDEERVVLFHLLDRYIARELGPIVQIHADHEDPATLPKAPVHMAHHRLEALLRLRFVPFVDETAPRRSVETTAGP
ncbi:hypothetical protein, partial [Burkholderia pseudomallei]|uniref:hypothetical protein n=1 Tax=Burkholderia pseudomallei TaxID=28450 RepID=UPI001620DDB8